MCSVDTIVHFPRLCEVFFLQKTAELKGINENSHILRNQPSKPSKSEIYFNIFA